MTAAGALLERVADGRTDLVLDWLAAGGAPQAESRGVALVAWCARYGDVSALRSLLASGASLEALGANLGLHGAAFHGHWRLCEFLLEQGADPNEALADTGETPLHACLTKANRPASELVLRVLLDRGADPCRAARDGAPTDAFMRDARTRGETPLHRAAAFASADAIRRLLESGARRDARDAHGDTPLSWASWHLRPDAVLRLLCHGPFTIHPERASAYDHGSGHGALEIDLLGAPHRPFGGARGER